jgi:hypothetical protein
VLRCIQVIKYGLIYIAVIAIFVALIALRKFINHPNMISLLKHILLAAIFRTALKFDCSLCDRL